MTNRFIGIDCGEEKVDLVWLGAHGERAGAKTVKNERGAIRVALIQILEDLGEHESLDVVLESLYAFSSPTAEVARDLGLRIFQVGAKALEAFRKVEGTPRKDDEQDAYLLARMGWSKVGACRLALDPTPEEQILRRLGRLHSRIVDQCRRSKQRLRSQLLELSPTLVSKDWEGPKWSSASMLGVLERWPALQGLENARISTIYRHLQKASNVSREKIKGQAEALKALARSLSESAQRDVLALEISYLVGTIRHHIESQKTIDAKIERHVKDHPVARKIQEMPGVGAFIAAVVTGELGPLARTSTEAKVATYAGLTPVTRKSGQRESRRLARGVNKHALNACYMSAIASLSRSALDKAYYGKQRASHEGHPKTHVVATIALARQRIKVMYRLMTTDAVYDREILIASHLERERLAA